MVEINKNILGLPPSDNPNSLLGLPPVEPEYRQLPGESSLSYRQRLVNQFRLQSAELLRRQIAALRKDT